MKNFGIFNKLKIISILVLVVFIMGCAQFVEAVKDGVSMGLADSNVVPKSKIAKNPLSKKQIKAKLVGGVLYRREERFFIFPNGKMIYVELDTNKKTHGSWYLRSMENSEGKQRDMICLAIGASKDKQFTKAPCHMLFPEKDEHGNLYLAVIPMCRISDIDAKGNIPCNWEDRMFGNFRITDEKMQ